MRRRSMRWHRVTHAKFFIAVSHSDWSLQIGCQFQYAVYSRTSAVAKMTVFTVLDLSSGSDSKASLCSKGYVTSLWRIKKQKKCIHKKRLSHGEFTLTKELSRWNWQISSKWNWQRGMQCYKVHWIGTLLILITNVKLLKLYIITTVIVIIKSKILLL